MTELAVAERIDAPGARTSGWAPLFVVLAGTFVTFLDFFIVNVALPSVGTELHATDSELSLVVAGFGLTFAAGMITGGRLGDLYGRRRMFRLGLALFTLTSAACGLAPNIAVLIAARMAQGASGALLTPQVLALLGSVYTGARRDKAFAGFGFAMGIAGVLGQLIGGLLIHADIAGAGWRSIFLINVPVGLVVVPLVTRTVPESRGDAGQRLDLVGALIGTLTVAALVMPLVEGHDRGWPLWTWLLLAAAPLLGAAFVAHQRRRTRVGVEPLVHLGLFRVRTFSVGVVAGLTFALVPSGLFFVLALYLQGGRGYSALFSGVVFVAVGVGYFAALLVAPRLATALGHQVLALGAAVVGVGALLLALAAGSGSALDLVPGLAAAGFGIGAVLVPLASTVLAGVEPTHAGAAAGTLTTFQQVGGALGIAVLGNVFFGAVGRSTVHAFTVATVVLAGLALLTVALVQVLHRRAH